MSNEQPTKQFTRRDALALIGVKTQELALSGLILPSVTTISPSSKTAEIITDTIKTLQNPSTRETPKDPSQVFALYMNGIHAAPTVFRDIKTEIELSGQKLDFYQDLTILKPKFAVLLSPTLESLLRLDRLGIHPFARLPSEDAWEEPEKFKRYLRELEQFSKIRQDEGKMAPHFTSILGNEVGIDHKEIGMKRFIYHSFIPHADQIHAIGGRVVTISETFGTDPHQQEIRAQFELIKHANRPWEKTMLLNTFLYLGEGLMPPLHRLVAYIRTAYSVLGYCPEIVATEMGPRIWPYQIGNITDLQIVEKMLDLHKYPLPTQADLNNPKIMPDTFDPGKIPPVDQVTYYGFAKFAYINYLARKVAEREGQDDWEASILHRLTGDNKIDSTHWNYNLKMKEWFEKYGRLDNFPTLLATDPALKKIFIP